MRKHPLRTRIIGLFIALTALVSVLYSLMSFVFAYHVEDHFFNAFIDMESQAISQQIAQGSSAPPRFDFITFYTQHSELPTDIRQFLTQHPHRTEIPLANGEHFHLKKFEHGYLLADVSNQLFVSSAKNELLSYLFVVFAFVSVIAILMGIAAYLVAKRLFKPLDELISIIEQAPVEQLPNGFAERFKNSEIGTFANALEQALTRIHAFIKREQLFTRDISHELRTPVTISQGAITLLKQTNLTDKQTDLIARVEHAQKQIEQSLTALLALAREENSKPAQTRILPLVEQSILQQHHYLTDKNIELAVNIKPQKIAPIGETPLLILLNNLISNAFKYSHSGIIEIEYADSSLLVRDCGGGISPTITQNIFDAGVKSNESQGLGMGLNIVKRLCEHLSIGCTLNTTKTGSEFVITFNKHNSA